ncbi:MAG: HAD-IB family hydrolase [Tissierellia bacterium]|jgi:HAD superfamily hydrolase (TIGR01490 family)|nr:HAD-IB family hydrolase [Tissierellia bacterium]
MKAAFFDIDGTLFRNSLLIEHFKKLIKYEVIDIAVWIEEVRDPFHNWSLRQGDYEMYLLDVSRAFKDSLKGKDTQVIEFISKQVIKMNWEKTYVYTRQRLNWHQEQGHGVFFISGSPDFLVSRMARKYSATDFRASTYIMEKDLFTGEVIPMWDYESKEKAILELVGQYGIDLDLSYAYGDTSGDLTMLRMSGHPFAMNPNQKLFEEIMNDESLKEKVEIVVERKDMIYSLKPKDVKHPGIVTNY